MAKELEVRSHFTEIALHRDRTSKFSFKYFDKFQILCYEIPNLKTDRFAIELGHSRDRYFVSAWKPSRQRIDDGKYAEKI